MVNDFRKYEICMCSYESYNNKIYKCITLIITHDYCTGIIAKYNSFIPLTGYHDKIGVITIRSSFFLSLCSQQQ